MTKISDDGYWQLVDGKWVPTESQLQALASGAVPHTDSESNLQSVNLPVSQSVAGQQTIIYSSSNSSGPNKTLITIAVITVCSILLVTLAGILYVWASSLAEESNNQLLVGTWTNPVDELVLKENGDATESTGTFETWYTRGNDIYFESGEGYYKYKYSVVNDIMYLMPYDENGDLKDDDCIAYLSGTSGSSESVFDERMSTAESNGEIPVWCKN